MTRNFEYLGDNTDFAEWDWGDEPELLEAAMAKVLANRMAVIFSDNGAQVLVNTLLSDGATGDFVVQIDIGIDQTNPIATVSIPLAELVVDYAKYAGSVWRRSASLALKDIAATIDALKDCPNDDMAIWSAPRDKS